MSTQENVDLVRRWFEEVWNQGKLETIQELLARDAVTIGQTEDGTPLRGPAQFTEFARRTRIAFPDIRVTIEDIFGHDDKVVTRWSATMTHTGDYLGLTPTNNVAKITGMSLGLVANGQIVGGWDNWDQLGLLKQIGALDPPLAKTA
jgi:steroid delta-isomerase-like uncharacterized protein